MEYRLLRDGERMPALGLGAFGIGNDPSQAGREVTAIQAAIEMGYTHIDTAELYADGRSEEVVGHAIRGADREKLFIATKVWKENLRYSDVMDAMDGSLRRLGTEYVDLYLIHAPNPAVPLGETFDALNTLVAEGNTRYIGVSNFDWDQLTHAYQLTGEMLVTNQVHYNLLVREPEENGVLIFCQRHDILLTAYSPLERGKVIHNEVVADMAEKYGATPAQIAIAWLIGKPNVTTIAKSINEARLRENLGALEVALSEEDVSLLDELVNR